MRDRQVARALAWAGIGLGLAEIGAPRWLSRRLGIRARPGTLRALGTREVLSGAAILKGRRPAPGLWARVAGDALDLALLGLASRRTRRPGALGTAAATVLGITALDLLYARRLQRD